MASSVGLDNADARASFDDFVAAFAGAVSLRAARVAGGGARAPAPPGRASAKRLRDVFSSACVDFDSAKKRSNANTLALPQWRRLCLGSGFVARKFPASAADVVFAKTRRAGERELRAEDFASALACVAAETGKTFESVVDAAAKCAAGGLFAGVSAGAPAARSERRAAAGTTASRFSLQTFQRNGVRASLDDRSFRSSNKTHNSNKTHDLKPVVSARESFPPARSFSSAAPESEALDAALSRPRAEDFDKGDVDGDGLLTPEELAGVLVRSCHAREADALELVRVCFGDVDLDKDGRVCFDEYRAFCKKAKRVLRRRALVAGSAASFGAAERSVRRLTFGTHGFGSARSASRETRTHRPASARVNRSLDALCEKNATAARPASARLFSRSFSGAARVPVEARARPRAFAEEDSTMDLSAADLSAADLTSLDLTVDEAFIADERDVTHDLEPVAEAFEAETPGDDARRATSSEGRRASVDSPVDAASSEDARRRETSETGLEKLLTKDARIPRCAFPLEPAFVDARRLAVWRAEFNAHDARKTGRLDLELATFALARLRLLEDLDVSLAARTLETRLAETAGGEDGDFDVDFEAFARFAAALEAARATQTRTEKPIAQPVPVRKEYALDDAHPFLALFRETFADARGEMDGDAFARVLRAARLTDDARLTATGVDVVFARARARHNKEGDRTARRVPYRIFLGALSLAAGHLGLDFETAAARVAAGAEAARAEGRGSRRAGVETNEDGKENVFRVTSREGLVCEGKRNHSAENTRSRLSAAFEGKA